MELRNKIVRHSVIVLEMKSLLLLYIRNDFQDLLQARVKNESDS
jgi:hypothetical protein